MYICTSISLTPTTFSDLTTSQNTPADLTAKIAEPTNNFNLTGIDVNVHIFGEQAEILLALYAATGHIQRPRILARSILASFVADRLLTRKVI
jgi:hypothetical protein